MTAQEIATVIQEHLPELQALCEQECLSIEFSSRGVHVLIHSNYDADGKQVNGPTRFARLCGDVEPRKSDCIGKPTWFYDAVVDGIPFSTNTQNHADLLMREQYAEVPSPVSAEVGT